MTIAAPFRPGQRRSSEVSLTESARRRSDHDVTNTVKISSASTVMRGVGQLLVSTWPGIDTAPIERAFRDFDDMFAGRAPGFLGVDTLYHDRQHTLDVTLAMARLLAGYERQAESLWLLGAERATAGVIMALFHDVGYLRRAEEVGYSNGAAFTSTHVSRGATFLDEYLQKLRMPQWAEVAREIVHFTGYERPFDKIRIDDPRDRRLGHLLGTADMIAQMSDRCYLEKCRDRLYPEFVLGGMALGKSVEGYPTVKYASGLDLLRQTPGFVAMTRAKRLDGAFGAAYKYLEILFDGRNPYIEAIDRSMKYLDQVLRSESWRMLRRSPPLYVAEPQLLDTVRMHMLGYFKKAWLRH
jgi:hypothetical protein